MATGTLPWFWACEHMSNGLDLKGDGAWDDSTTVNQYDSIGTIGSYRAQNWQNRYGYITIPSESTGLVVGWRQYGTTNDRYLMGFLNGSGQEVCSIRSSGGSYGVYGGGGTKITGSDVAYSTNTNTYFEVAILFDNAAGLVRFAKDGTEIVNLSSKDTINNAVPVTKIQFGDNTNSNTLATHFYIKTWDGIASPYYGPLVFYYHLPTSDVAANWTPKSGGNNYSQVDDTTQDADSTYISTDVLNTEDQYECTDLPAGVNSCVAVVVGCVAQAPSGGAPAVSLTLEQNSVKYTNPAQPIGPAGTYKNTQAVAQLLAPDGTIWTESKVNAMRIGIKAA